MEADATGTAPEAASSGGVAAVRTLLLIDLVDSTRWLERLGDRRAAEILRRHDRLARDLLARHGGREIDKTDGFLLLFERPAEAVRYALDYHRTLQDLSRREEIPLQARAAIHLGEVLLRDNPPEDVARGAKPLEVEGLAKPMTARLLSLARDRQTLLTRSVFDLAREGVGGGQGSGGRAALAGPRSLSLPGAERDPGGVRGGGGGHRSPGGPHRFAQGSPGGGRR